jgi:hypothetical protein
MSDAHELVAVSVDITGKPSYNGYETVHEALWNLEEEFRTLEFVDRMMLSIDILSDLEPSIFHNRNFIYTFDYDEGLNDRFYSVYDGSNVDDPIFECWAKELYDYGIMKDEYDVLGLFKYLVKIGELLPTDSLTLIHA